MRRSVALLVVLWALLPGGGCRNCDLVEAELRTRENEVRELRAELLRAESTNDALQREIHAAHTSGTSKVSPELASQMYTLKEVVLGRQTGGIDEDSQPGDEALQVVLEPRDPDGHAIKAPGTLHVEALQIGGEGLKTPLSSWDVSPDQLRRTWRSGLFATGYFVVLPWKVWPTSTRLRVVARFTLPDDRVFEADKDVTIRLPPQPKVPASPAPAPAPLPPPRPVPGEANLVEPAAVWRPPAAPPLYRAVQLLRPGPLQ
jgi:hypothetical protein